MNTYKNPFFLENQWSDRQCGDPFIMRFDGMYYMYCSSDGNYIKCWSSEDLVNFKYEGSVCDDPYITGAYAPEVTYYKGRFYMITSPKGSGHYLLGSDNPKGPFSIISDNFGLTIDGSFFVDDDGKQYMLRAGHHGIVIHDMPSPEKIDVNGTTISEAFLNHWTEGPMIIKRNGLYYLTYTGNHLLSKGYRVAYSVSESGPDRGYVNLKNRTLLLETRPEFHALGHSSSVLAPDLDSYCIAYHSFDLDCNPHKRSMNIDRLFFNGARMYCNPVWWEQSAHKMPDFYCRGKDKLQKIHLLTCEYDVTSVKTRNTYTAEINVKPNEKDVKIIYGLCEEKFGIVQLTNNREYQVLEDGNIKHKGILSEAISFAGNVTIRFAVRSDRRMEVYINQMHLCSYQTELGEGQIGIRHDDHHEVGFVGFSSSVAGSEDKYANKAIPGRFDAVHCEEEIAVTEFLDAGLKVYGGCLERDKEYTYSVNVKHSGRYNLAVRMKCNAAQIELKAVTNDGTTVLKGYSTGLCDEEGYEMVTLGMLEIKEGIQPFIIIPYSDEVVIDYFDFTEYCELMPCKVIEKGHLVTDCLQILGHKRNESMIHKYSGFTCAENHGVGFIGEAGMSDYKISSVINMNSENTGDVSIYVRVTKESWFHAQVNEALFGYRIRVTVEGVYLYRESYDESLLAYYSFQGIKKAKRSLQVEADQAKLVITIDEKTEITYHDSIPYLFGKIGMEVTGDGFGFEYLSICQ